MVFDKVKKIFSESMGKDVGGDEYLEIDLDQHEKKDKKVLVKLFVLTRYEDVNEILSALRGGYTIAIIDIRTLRKKDSIELKRAISKIKKTADALEGSIAGFLDGTVIVAPSFAEIRKEEKPQPKEDKANKFE